MRHNNKINHLGRTHSHREAMLSNMAVSLIKHKRIFTTLAKAKELRRYVEPLITKCKDDSTHSRRVVFSNLRDKYAVTELFQEVSQKIGDRPGGYTRIIKTGNRLGDNAETCFIELVDYNELMLKEKKAPAKGKTRRSRGKKSGGAAAATATAEAPAKESAPKAEKPAKEVAKAEVAAAVEEATKPVEAAAEKAADATAEEETPKAE
ncbi:MAG: 50S ribosomal protein L17 [Dysgonamonadaceae bacterium]|jgi:large subunit ribosomal protein L17|nr:50S ribosomal protein L17 [Dysgonamonadaceae bacterium]